jgi:hypothetical protein
MASSVDQLELRLTDTVSRWGVMWYSKNEMDGVRKHLMYGWPDSTIVPLLFRTRKEAREYIKEKWGYIKDSPDLRVEPHGWRMPRAVRVECSYKYQEWPYA